MYVSDYLFLPLKASFPRWAHLNSNIGKKSIHYKMWDEIMYPFPDFNDEAVEVCECDHLFMLGSKLIHVSKSGRWSERFIKTASPFWHL